MSLKYNEAKVEIFIDMFITGQYTLKNMCDMAGFSMTTYYYWKRTNEDFKKKLAVAESMRIGEIKEMATRGLMRLIEGGTYEEIHEEYERPEVFIPLKYPYLDADDPANLEAREKALAAMPPIQPVLVKRRVSTKVIMPNSQSVQFALRNVDKENFPDLQKAEIDNKNTGPIPVLLVKPGSIDTRFPNDLEAPANDNDL